MIVTFVTQADQNGIDSQWNLFFTDLDELQSEYVFIFYLFTNFAKDNLAGEISQNYCSNNETPKYEQHRPTNDIAITENFTIGLENAVRALQSVSHFVS